MHRIQGMPMRSLELNPTRQETYSTASCREKNTRDGRSSPLPVGAPPPLSLVTLLEVQELKPAFYRQN